MIRREPCQTTRAAPPRAHRRHPRRRRARRLHVRAEARTRAREAPVLHRPPGRRGRGRDRADRPRPAGRPGRGRPPGRPRSRRDRLHRRPVGRLADRPEGLRRRPVEQPAHLWPRPDGQVRPARPGGEDRLAQPPDRLARPVRTGNRAPGQAGRRRLHPGEPYETGQDPRHPVGERVHQRCCSSTPSRACTPAPNTAATGTWSAGRRSASPATSSRAATPPTRWSGPTATTRSPIPGSPAEVLKLLGAL